MAATGCWGRDCHPAAHCPRGRARSKTQGAFDAGHARFRAAQTAHQGPDMTDFFKGIPQIKYEGPNSTNEFAFRHYNPDEVVHGQADGRPPALCRRLLAFSFAWPGGDPFGGQTLERPWFGDTMALAKLKADVAFEMFDILGVPFYCFHDADACGPRARPLRKVPEEPERDRGLHRREAGQATRPSSSGARPTCSAIAAGCRALRPTPIRTSTPMPPRR